MLCGTFLVTRDGKNASEPDRQGGADERTDSSENGLDARSETGDSDTLLDAITFDTKPRRRFHAQIQNIWIEETLVKDDNSQGKTAGLTLK